MYPGDGCHVVKQQPEGHHREEIACADICCVAYVFSLFIIEH